MNILMLLTNPFTNDMRVYNEAKALIQAGHQVTVIAHDTERQHPEIENWDGIRVFRLRTKSLLNRHYLFRLLLYPSTIFSWNWQAYRKALALHQETHFHAIHSHDFDTLSLGICLKKRLGLSLIYDAHEIYGYMMTRVLPRRIANVFLWLERRLIKMVDRIIVVTEYQKNYLEKVTDKSISIIMNCKAVESLEYQPPNNQGKFIVVYIGGLNKRRFVLELCNTIAQTPDITCLIAGKGDPKYVQTLKEACSSASNVIFLGLIPPDEVIPLTKNADICVCMIDPEDPNNRLGLANKQFEAMVCGRPIICTKGTSSGEITEHEETGLTVEYTEDALKQAVIRLRDDPELRERLGRNALKAAITKYNWQNQERKLLEIYRSIEAEHQPICQ